VKNKEARQVLVQNSRNINGDSGVARGTVGEGIKSWKVWEYRLSGGGVVNCDK